MKFLWILFGLLTVGYTAVPEAPRNDKSRRVGPSVDCNEPVAFSAVTDHKNAKSKKGTNSVIVFDQSLVHKSVGYDRETGIFTAHCPGLYQFTFTAHGDNNSRFSLRKRPSSSTASWITLVVTDKSGGTHTIFTDMEAREEAAVFVDSGSISDSSQTFSGFRISKSKS